MQQSPVYLIMAKPDVYDITLIATIECLLQALTARNTDVKSFRGSKLSTMHETLWKLEGSYKGMLPDQYMDLAKDFEAHINTKLNLLLNDCKS